MDFKVYTIVTLSILGILMLVTGVSCGEEVVSNKLYKQLFDNYTTQLLPICTPGDNVNITFDIALRQIISLDEKDQILTTNVWIRMSWPDCRLTWNVSEHHGVSDLYVPYADVWTPDLALYDSSAEEVMMPGLPDYRAHIESDGRVSYNFPTVIKSICRVNVTHFPFDTQECNLKFGSWSHTIKDIDFVLADATKGMRGDLANFVMNNEWIVNRLTPDRSVKNYTSNDVTQYYTEIDYKIVMERRSVFYVMTMMFPCILVSAIAAVGFLLPSESGEKVSLEVTVLLSQAVFLLVISDFLPPSAEHFPIVGTYFAVSMLLVCMSLVLSVLVLNVHHRGDINGRTVPRWTKHIVNFIDRCCRYKDDYDMKQETNHTKSDIKCSNRKPEMDLYEADENTKCPLQETILGENDVKMNGRDNIMNHLPNNPRNRLSPLGSSSSVQDETMQIFMQEQTATLTNIMHHFKDTDDSEEVREDWQKLARVLDRVFLFLYITCFVTVTLTFFIQLKFQDTSADS